MPQPDVVIQCDQQTPYGQRKRQCVGLGELPMASKKTKDPKENYQWNFTSFGTEI